MDAIRRQIGLRHGSSPVSYGVDISDPERSLGAHGGFIAAFAFVPPPVDYIRVHESHGATVWNGMCRWQAISGYVVEGYAFLACLRRVIHIPCISERFSLRKVRVGSAGKRT